MCSFAAPTARSVRGRGTSRLAAVALVSGIVAASALTAAGPASAGEAPPQSRAGAGATMGGLKTFGAAVVHDGGQDQQVSAGLFEMSVDGGGTLQTYCVDLYNPTQRDAKYHETPWSGTSLGANKDAGRIRWILQHSYPQVNDLAALAEAAGIHGGLTEQDAAAGTQVAIWRYSDGVDVDAVDPQAEQLADHLFKSARQTSEPAASLTLDPPAVSGHPGELLGPVTVRTGAAGVAVSPPADAAMSGVRIVGKDGKPVITAADGTQLFFAVPEGAAAGSAQLTVQASTTVPVGRAFTSDSRSQTQILAGSSESTVSATASATWAARGPIPALSAKEDCVKGGVDITAVNRGDQPFTFELMGTAHSVPAGASRTVTMPLQEDQPYDVTITGAAGLSQRFTGVLDCRTRGGTTTLSTQTVAEPSPATVGGSTGTAGSSGSGGPTDLADTGGSTLTPLIAGSAIGLVVIGGAVLVLLRRREADQG
ncbi:peptidase [Streptomyces sp. Ru71]|uniref:TQXA domain-containing protein n=1 Tax=Streptomyces sp. Ru71 TaxID=2080746 RepID=UPI000CDD30D6|nr:TQXA domain-containing protein [Streptomyces sp. Ru71]POX47979.1 peptidase [Streptomyces sp. Ru71]